jgi:hypothetical protein
LVSYLIIRSVFLFSCSCVGYVALFLLNGNRIQSVNRLPGRCNCWLSEGKVHKNEHVFNRMNFEEFYEYG